MQSGIGSINAKIWFRIDWRIPYAYCVIAHKLMMPWWCLVIQFNSRYQ